MSQTSICCDFQISFVRISRMMQYNLYYERQPFSVLCHLKQNWMAFVRKGTKHVVACIVYDILIDFPLCSLADFFLSMIYKIRLSNEIITKKKQQQKQTNKQTKKNTKKQKNKTKTTTTKNFKVDGFNE